MFMHIVLLRFREEVDENEIAHALDSVRNMKNGIPGIAVILAEKNLSMKHLGFMHGFVIFFADESYYLAYRKHPAHQPVADELDHLCDSIIDFDCNFAGFLI